MQHMTSIIRVIAALFLAFVAAAPASAARDERTGSQRPAAALSVDETARLKLEAARAALKQLQYDAAGLAVLEVIRMAGVPERRQAEAYTVGCDLGMRTRDWELAKTMCERVLTFNGAATEHRAWATDTLTAIRKQAPELFKPKGR